MRSITEQVMSSRRPGIIRSQRAAHLVRVRVRVRVRARARARARVRVGVRVRVRVRVPAGGALVHHAGRGDGGREAWGG